MGTYGDVWGRIGMYGDGDKHERCVGTGTSTSGSAGRGASAQGSPCAHAAVVLVGPTKTEESPPPQQSSPVLRPERGRSVANPWEGVGRCHLLGWCQGVTGGKPVGGERERRLAEPPPAPPHPSMAGDVGWAHPSLPFLWR